MHVIYADEAAEATQFNETENGENVMWYSLNLGNAHTALAQSEKIQNAFTREFALRGFPLEMAVFSDSTPGLRETVYYF